ncbi:hypothetical protein [Parerythrobacter jejuensis]|uniref:Uncharacterized protein n=1 Tax=Parerythrobacter jejuensis TaxID=795812 RepID=A0A845ART2_9SPHN|nr:hypothetical protein [Parerythrobacter jejuensis]MXP31635.1 hypothetical protein [Parerythrobacter jejuensis]
MNLIPSNLRPASLRGGDAQVDATKAEGVYRLKVGFLGLGTMILLVGVADIIMDRAQQTEDTAVPQAAPTVEPEPEPTQNNALENAGVVPDLPEEAEAEPVPEGPVLPEQGEPIEEE